MEGQALCYICKCLHALSVENAKKNQRKPKNSEYDTLSFLWSNAGPLPIEGCLVV